MLWYAFEKHRMKGVAMTLGERVKTLRERQGLTQSELAQRCGIAQATISRLETGDLKDVQSSVAKRLARALGVTVDYLVGMYEDEGQLQPAAVALVGA
jgi:transcriptional regulator with XRE-family HTH domain